MGEHFHAILQSYCLATISSYNIAIQPFNKIFILTSYYPTNLLCYLTTILKLVRLLYYDTTIYSVNKQTNMKLSSSIGFAFTVELRNVSEVKMCRELFYDDWKR